MTQRKNESKRNHVQRKALLAIAFAGGMLNPLVPALAETDSKSESSESQIQKVANSTLTPEFRAYYLLHIASQYLSDRNKKEIVAQFANILNDEHPNSYITNPRGTSAVGAWVNRISLEPHSKSQSIPAENVALANNAIEKALVQLGKASEKSAKLNMYFIALRLCQQTGNADGIRECNQALEDDFRACESKNPVAEEEVKAATTILNLMANDIIRVSISDLDPKNSPVEQQTPVRHFTEKEFKESERLRLRAAAMSDRLATNNHVRRKTHRDLVLWYMQLGKMEMADKEKQVLFELVGRTDDSILYPQIVGCGHFLWWEKIERTGQTGTMACGMG